MHTKIFKKVSVGTLIFQTLLSILMVMGMHGMVFAAPPPAQTQASEAFSVGKYLTATEQGQNSIYLKSANPIASFIIQIINFLSLTIGSFCFLAIVIGGFMLLTSHGNENMLTKGKDVIKYALIGLVIVLMAYYITAFVQSLFYEVPK